LRLPTIPQPLLAMRYNAVSTVLPGSGRLCPFRNLTLGHALVRPVILPSYNISRVLLASAPQLHTRAGA